MGIVWELGHALFSEFKEKVLNVSPKLFDPQSEGGDQASGRGFRSVQPLGLLARPADPTKDPQGKVDKAAGFLYGFIGNRAFGIPTTDPRAVDKIPPCTKGGTNLHSTGTKVGFVDINGESGSIMLYVPFGHDASGTPSDALYISLDAAAPGEEQIRVGFGSGGPAFTLMASGKKAAFISNAADNARIGVDDDGVLINGNTTVNGGHIAGDPTTAQPLALYPDLATFAAQVTAALATIAGAAGSVVPPITVPTALPVASSKASASP